MDAPRKLLAADPAFRADVLAGLAAAVAEWLHDVPLYYPAVGLDYQLALGVFMLISGGLIAGAGSWLLTRSLAQTGVLAGLESGRLQERV